MIVEMLILLVTFIKSIHLNLVLSKEAPTLKVLIKCKKLLNIIDKTVIYQLAEGVLSNL